MRSYLTEINIIKDQMEGISQFVQVNGGFFSQHQE